MRISAVFLSMGLIVGITAAVAADTQSRADAPTNAVPTASQSPTLSIQSFASGPNIVIGPAPVWTKHHILLDGEEALTRLQKSNPRHYAVARRILAAATEICNRADPGPIPTKYGADYVGCAHGLWLTSNPPKREIFFHIDDTDYSARVVVRDLGTKLVPAQ